MSRVEHNFPKPERFVIGTVGVPGERQFYLQVREGSRLLSFALEKTQAAALGERAIELLREAAHFPKYSLRNVLSPELIKYMRQDKKNQSGEINFTLLKRIGKGTINHTFSDQQIAMALNYYDSL